MPDLSTSRFRYDLFLFTKINIFSKMENRIRNLCRSAVLNLDPFQLRQDRDQHRENAGGSADDIGNRLGEEYAVGSHMHGVGEKVGQRYNDEYLAEQGEEDRLFLFV